jgi:signal transduction histidine kinase
MRLAVLMFAVFLTSGAALLAVTYAIWHGQTDALRAAPVPARGPLSHTSGITRVTSDGHQLLIASAIALTIMAVASLLIGWLLAGRFLRSVRTITAMAREITASNLKERLDHAGPDDELKELADTFDELLGRLDRSFESERRFVANASHELRTPLAAMRTSLDVAMAKPEAVPAHIRTLEERLRRELDHSDRLLESFLALARAQHGPAGDESTVSLAQLARVAIDLRLDAGAAAGLDIDQQHSSEAWVTGSATLLARLVENLIDNAIGHNRAGGWVQVTTAVDGGRAVITVENSGAILDPEQVAELATPFRRMGAERTGSDTGSGLGLAIVSSIADVHGGTLHLRARPDGGLRAAVALSLAVVPAAGAPA